jgi:hypothetical protein
VEALAVLAAAHGEWGRVDSVTVEEVVVLVVGSKAHYFWTQERATRSRSALRMVTPKSPRTVGSLFSLHTLVAVLQLTAAVVAVERDLHKTLLRHQALE